MERGVVLGAVLGLGVLSIAVSGQQGVAAQADAPKVVEVEKVRDNLYMLKGGGGNTGVFITSTGVVVIDTKNPGWGQPLLEKIRTLTDKPITMVINTHTHGDHTSGQLEFPADIQVVSQASTRANMAKLEAYKKPENMKYLPKQTFNDKLSLLSGADRIDLHYFGRAHTNGDAWVVFPALRVMHTGDAFAYKDIMRVDANNGGSVREYPRTLASVVRLVKDVDTLIVGHTPTTMTPKDLSEYAEFARTFVEWGTAQHKSGKTTEQAIAAYKTPDRFAGYASTPARLKEDVELLYKELEDGKQPE